MQFSIVAITYNQPSHIESVCKSLLLMDFDRSQFEVIIIDDGSNPPVSSLISLPQSINLKTIYIPRDSVSGRAKARNLGAATASGEYIVFIDGDCLVGVDFLAKYKEYLANNSTSNVVLGSFYSLDGQFLPDRLTIDYLQSLEKKDLYHSSDFRFYLEKLNNASIWDIHASWLLFISRNFCIRRSLFIQLKGFDERFVGWGSEDTEFAYRLVKHSQKFDLIQNKVFHVPESLNVESDQKKYISWVKNIGLFYSIHKDPVILLLMTQERLIFDAFIGGRGWDNELQIKTFQALKKRIELFK